MFQQAISSLPRVICETLSLYIQATSMVLPSAQHYLAKTGATIYQHNSFNKTQNWSCQFSGVSQNVASPPFLPFIFLKSCPE